MIVVGIQMDIAWENPRENFRRAREWAEVAMEGTPGSGAGMAAGESPPSASTTTEQGPDLLVLPEMFATGFSMAATRVAAFAEETREFMADLATQLSVHVLGGYAEPSDPNPANACSIFSPSGREVLHFRKLHPFSLAGEENHYVGGERLETVDVEGVRVTPLICYDLRFPEPFRIAANRTDLYCVIANWPEKRRDAWTSLLRARAMENQAYVLGVNRVGLGGGENHTGDSVLLDPVGRVEACGAANGSSEEREGSPPNLLPGESGLVVGEVNPKRVSRIRGKFSFLKDRKPDLYRRLEAAQEED